MNRYTFKKDRVSHYSDKVTTIVNKQYLTFVITNFTAFNSSTKEIHLENFPINQSHMAVVQKDNLASKMRLQLFT